MYQHNSLHIKKLNNLVVNKSLNYSYIQIECNGKKEMISNIFSAYVVLLLKDIKYPVFLQEWKLNLDAAVYEKHIGANMSKTSDKR